MDNIRQIFRVSLYNFKKWHRNPRIITVFLMNFMLCLFFSEKILSFVTKYDTILQISESFNWIFGDAKSVMIFSLLLIFLFSDMPFVTKATPYVLNRCSKRNWMLGQVLYVCLATVFLVLATFLFTCIITSKYAFIGNQWSETAAMIVYSGVGEKIAIPASLSAMEGALPYQCAVHIFFLLLGYTLVLATLLMRLNLQKQSFLGGIGVLLINGYGLLLKPDIFMELFQIPQVMSYKANVMIGWASLLNHATYHMHNFGFNYLPRLWMSYLIFLILIIVNIRSSLKKIKAYEFDFVQEEE